jgi:L-lactate dehydrogenase (cytochrome)
VAAAVSIDDMRAMARRRLPASVYGYLDGGADDEATLALNRAQFAGWGLLPRFLVDVSQVDCTITVLGSRLAMPVLLAPTGLTRMFHPDGERTVSRAAAHADTMYALSTMASTSIEDVARSGAGARCFQVYPFKDRGLVREFIGRARAAGYTSLCVTVDVPVFGNRERDRRAGLTLPPRVTVRRLREALARPGWTWRYVRSAPLELANVRHVAPAGHGGLATLADYVNAQFFPAVRWSDIEWMIDQWSGPFAVKGLLHPVDIRQAAALGATAVVLSNHGVDNSTARSRRFRCSRRLNAGFSSPSRSSSTAARGGVPTS